MGCEHTQQPLQAPAAGAQELRTIGSQQQGPKQPLTTSEVHGRQQRAQGSLVTATHAMNGRTALTASETHSTTSAPEKQSSETL